jgi:hypothetical protein
MQKIKDTELELINALKKDAMEIVYNLGELEYQKAVLELQVDENKKKIKELKLKEQQVFRDLEDTYGRVSINLETGEYS